MTAALVLLVASTTTNGSTSGFPATELAKLKTSDAYRFLLPTSVPKGLKFQGQNLEESESRTTFSWSASWKNPKTKASLVIQMASDGLGDPILSDDKGDILEVKEKTFKSGMFGDVWSVYAKKQWAIGWTEVPGPTYPRVVMLIGENISYTEGVKIFRSLRWYKP